MTDERAGRRRAEIEEELAFHIREAAEEGVRDGLSVHDAYERAYRRFGDFDAHKRACAREQDWTSNTMQRAHFALTTLLLLALIVLVAQRSTAARAQRQEATQATLDALMASTADVRMSEETRFDFDHLAVGDVLRVVELADPTGVLAESTVQADGMILLPQLGWVEAEGLDRFELVAELNRRYEPFMVDPPAIQVALVRQVGRRTPTVDAVIVRAGDRLRIVDEAHPAEISVETRVDRSGALLLPELGVVKVEGLSRPRLEQLLTERYREYFEDEPELRVIVH